MVVVCVCICVHVCMCPRPPFSPIMLGMFSDAHAQVVARSTSLACACLASVLCKWFSCILWCHVHLLFIGCMYVHIQSRMLYLHCCGTCTHKLTSIYACVEIVRERTSYMSGV